MAHRYIAKERDCGILQTTALVNELYLRLGDIKQMGWKNRSHFLAVCAQVMRRILVDFARSRQSLKRGGQALQAPLDEHAAVFEQPCIDLLALEEALNRLAVLDPRKSSAVELRFFGGLDVQETAEALDVSPETVMRDWKLAKSWLLRELTRDHVNGP